MWALRTVATMVSRPRSAAGTFTSCTVAVQALNPLTRGMPVDHMVKLYVTHPSLERSEWGMKLECLLFAASPSDLPAVKPRVQGCPSGAVVRLHRAKVRSCTACCPSQSHTAFAPRGGGDTAQAGPACSLYERPHGNHGPTSMHPLPAGLPMQVSSFQGKPQVIATVRIRAVPAHVQPPTA